MKKLQFSFIGLLVTMLITSTFILSLAMFNSTKTGTNLQSHLLQGFRAKSQLNIEKAEGIANEKLLYLNSQNNEKNQFIIDEFKIIYRVKA